MKKLLISILLLTCSIAHAQDEGLQSLYLRKFLGLQQKLNPKLLDDSESLEMSNFTLDVAGAIEERPIFSKYNNSSGILGSNSITGLFKLYSSVDKFFIGMARNKVASGTAGAFSTDITPTSDTVMAGTFWDAATFADKMWFANHSVPLQKYGGASGESLNTSGDSPGTNCRYVEPHKGRLWAASSESIPFRVYLSNVSNGDLWDDFVDLPDSTQTITGLKSWGGRLYVFTETDIYYLIGSTTTTFELIKANSDVGAIAPRSIQVADIGIFFLARTGVFSFNGSRSTKLSDKIEPTINDISRTLIKNAAGLWDGQGRYWLSYADKDSSQNDKVIIYDTVLKEWYPFDNLNINYFTRAFGGTDRGELYGGSSFNDGIVWLLQEASGTETIIHDTRSEFLTGTTFNTALLGTKNSPKVVLKRNDNNENTVLLMNMDGLDGGATFPDSSIGGNNGSGHGNATVVPNVLTKTATKRYGSASAYFDGVVGSLSYSDNDDWSFGTEDFTIEFWARFDTFDNGDYPSFVNQYGNVNNLWRVQASKLAGVTKLSMYFIIGGVEKGEYNVNTPLVTDTWYHIAFVRSGATGYIFVNGVDTEATETLAFGANDVGNLSVPLIIGELLGAGTVDGYIDELIITKEAKYVTGFDPHTQRPDGNLTSTLLEINTSGIPTLGEISWGETTPAGTNIQLTTRTGETGDTVYFNGWGTWTSPSSATINTVTDYTAWFTSSMDNFYLSGGIDESDGLFQEDAWNDLSIDVLGYESYDSISPNFVEFAVSRGTVSTNQMAATTIPDVNISGYTWIGYWLWSPATGNSVKLGIGEVSGNTIGTITASTAKANEWEYHYWPLSEYSSTDLDAIIYMELEYLGEIQGAVRLAEISVYDFFDNDETITSTPDDYIQYRVIMGSTVETETPELTSLTLEYTPVAGTSETSLSSNYKTKFLDFKSPNRNKQFLDIFVEASADNDEATLTVDYDIDNGQVTGSVVYTIDETPNTVRLEDHFPSSTFGKSIQLDFINTDLNSKVKVEAAELRARLESLN